MSYKKTTIADIAKAASVSSTTVSMILNGRAGVSFSKETVDKVLQLSAEMGYCPSQQHRSSKTSLPTVLVACPNMSNHYYSRIVQAIEQEADANNYQIIVRMHYRDIRKEMECVELAQQIGADGIIFATMPNNVELLESIKSRTPVVIIGDRDSRVGLDTVELNDYNAGELLASHLASLGHRYIGFISTSLGEMFAMRQRRLLGLRETMKRKDSQSEVFVSACNVRPEEELGDIDIEYNIGYRLTTEALQEHPEITAFVAVNDSVAAGVMDAILGRGFRIPQDYSVCGCDNIRESRYEYVSLTTVEHQLEEKGRYAFHILLKRMNGTLTSDRITHAEYPNRLMERNSTGRVRRGKGKR